MRTAMKIRRGIIGTTDPITAAIDAMIAQEPMSLFVMKGAAYTNYQGMPIYLDAPDGEPVTEVSEPAGAVLDLVSGEYLITQSVSADRPVLGADSVIIDKTTHARLIAEAFKSQAVQQDILMGESTILLGWDPEAIDDTPLDIFAYRDEDTASNIDQFFFLTNRDGGDYYRHWRDIGGRRRDANVTDQAAAESSQLIANYVQSDGTSRVRFAGTDIDVTSVDISDETADTIEVDPAIGARATLSGGSVSISADTAGRLSVLAIYRDLAFTGDDLHSLEAMKP